MSNLFIHYPKCSTCIKARKWLDTNGVSYHSRHITENNPTMQELKEWIDRSGLPIKSFFNTSGTLYKEMNLSILLPKLSEHEQLTILGNNGMLVKRPLLVTNDTVLVGFKDMRRWEILLNK